MLWYIVKVTHNNKHTKILMSSCSEENAESFIREYYNDQTLSNVEVNQIPIGDVLILSLDFVKVNFNPDWIMVDTQSFIPMA